MVVQSTQGGNSNKSRNSSISSEKENVLTILTKNTLDSLSFHPVDIETAPTDFLPHIIFSIIMSMIFGVISTVYVLITKKEITGRAILVFFSSFLSLFLIPFLIGYVYKKVLGKENDVPLTAYAYSVLMSFVHIPFALVTGLLVFIIKDIFTLAILIISQYLVTGSVLKNHSFASSSDQFAFNISVFLCQGIFIFIFMIYLFAMVTYDTK